MNPEPSWTFALLPRSGKTAWRRGRLPSSLAPRTATEGLINDAGMAILGSATVSSIKSEMQPGMTPVIIEADEASPNAVDDIVAQGGGVSFAKPKASIRGPSKLTVNRAGST
jgi:hypothetical protein